MDPMDPKWDPKKCVWLCGRHPEKCLVCKRQTLQTSSPPSVWDLMGEAYADCPVYQKTIHHTGKQVFKNGILQCFESSTTEILFMCWITCEPIKVMQRPVLRWAKQQQKNIDKEKRTKAIEVITSMEDTIGQAIRVQISTIFNVEQEDAFDLFQNLMRCVDVDANVLLYAFILFVRLENKMQEKGSETPKNVVRVHLFCSCFYLAVKMLEDRSKAGAADVLKFVYVIEFAEGCHLDKQVYLDMELFICRQLDWQLHVSVEQYVACIETFESFPQDAEKYAEKKEALLQMFKHQSEAHTAEFAVADPDVNAIARSRPFAYIKEFEPDVNAIARSRPFLQVDLPFPWKRFVRCVYPDSYGSD